MEREESPHLLCYRMEGLTQFVSQSFEGQKKGENAEGETDRDRLYSALTSGDSNMDEGSRESLSPGRVSPALSIGDERHLATTDELDDVDIDVVRDSRSPVPLPTFIPERITSLHLQESNNTPIDLAIDRQQRPKPSLSPVITQGKAPASLNNYWLYIS